MILPTDEINLTSLQDRQITLHLRREDKIHPQLSGNKFRKLKYNIEEAKKQNYHTLLTFGGAYSNHLLAVAYAAKENNLRSIALVRGEEIADLWSENPTLVAARDLGMQLEFISRERYRNKTDAATLDHWAKTYGPTYLIPEGGTNSLAIRGCEEILKPQDQQYDIICCSVGTGGTLAGLSNSTKAHQKVLGFSALKGDFLQKDIRKFAPKKNWELSNSYHFGGYGKITRELVEFINQFKTTTDIPLDPVYTGKMMFGILELIKKGHFVKGSKILAIHTGGLQGIVGMNQYLKKKKLPLLAI